MLSQLKFLEQIEGFINVDINYFKTIEYVYFTYAESTTIHAHISESKYKKLIHWFSYEENGQLNSGENSFA